MIGQILGDNSQLNSQRPQYEVTQILGKKAGRRTLLAKQVDTGELVVIKLLIFGSEFEWQDLKLFEREAETLKHLSHPAIPRYLDYFEIKSSTLNGFALVQTYIPAESLEQHIKSNRTFTEVEVKEIAKNVLQILVYLHQQNPAVIHRDIKPSNILLGDRTGNSVGKVYLVDFGAVQSVAATEGGTMTIVGTYGYMPPEQFGDRAVPASDLYSLGATLIYLVTGTHPADLPQKNLQIQFEQVANLSPTFTNWLQLMIQPSLDERLPSAKEALKTLEKPPIPRKSNSQAIKTTRPNDTKIQLTKSKNFLEIIIPPRGFRVSTITVSLFSVSVIWILKVITWSLLPYSHIFMVKLIFLVHILVSLGMMYWSLFGFFGRRILHINQQKIDLISEIFGWKYSFSEPAATQDVCMVQRIREHVYSTSGLVIKPKIVIWAGKNKKFELGGDNELLTEPELDWLVTELCDWLDIPMIRE
jgi:serine/threonine protein kinase